MTVSLIWATPNADGIIADLARVSAPENQGKPETAARLISYLIRNKHWSPFDMASICFEINTTRDIGRQMLRHWSLKPQEFSQRYADVGKLDGPVFREARMQDKTNRQNSLPCGDAHLAEWWQDVQEETWDLGVQNYNEALKRGIAKEVARVLLPEGLTPTRMYFSGTVRSWIHFCEARLHTGAQKEIVQIAVHVSNIMDQVVPSVQAALRLE